MAGGTRLASILLISVFLFVRAQDDIREPPKILEPVAPRVEVYGLGVDVTLQCRASGQPTPLYKWYWNGAHIDFSNQAISSTGLLTIKGLTTRDEGFYNCRARNTFSNGMSAVVVSPTIEIRHAYIERWRKGEDKTKIVPERNYAFITCGDTLPKYSGPTTFQWFIGDSINIQEDDRVFIDSKGTLHFAYVLQTDEHSDKFYTCRLSNVVEEQLAPGRTRMVVQEPNSSDITSVGQDRAASCVTATQSTDLFRRDQRDCGGCGWEPIHRGCYSFTVDPLLGWEDALMDCQGRGGELMSVSDMGERRQLLKKLKAVDKNRTWWVGLKRDRGRWDKWIDGGPFSYRVTRWKRGEPNNEGGKENCAEISSRGELNDKDCNSLRAFICEQHDITTRPTIVPSVKPRPLIQRSSVKPTLQFSTKMAGQAALTFQRKKEGQLECFFSGYVNDPGNEVPSIEWQDSAGNTIVSGTDRYIIESNGRVLKIANLVEADEQSHTCIGRNRIGSAEGRMVLNVTSPPIWVKPMESIRVPRGQYAVFHCEARSAAGEVPPDPPRWFKNDQPLDVTYDPNKFVFTNEKRELRVTSVQDNDVGCFQCYVSNSEGEEVGNGCLTVISPPIWVKPMEDTTVPRGKDAVFHCEARSAAGEVPPDPPRWFKNDQRLDVTYDPNKFVFTNEKRELRVTSVQDNDVGCFQCYVSNSEGEEVGNGCLAVTSPPIWVKPMEDTTVPRGKDAVFHCEARSAAGEVPPDPPRWFKNDQRLDVTYDPNKFVFTDEKRELRVTSVQDNDVGCFQCYVSNSEGEVVGNGCLTVTSPPIWVKLMEDITVPRGQYAVVHCKARSAAGEVPPDHPRWFKYEQPLDVTYDPNKFVFTDGKRELRVTSVQDNDVGCFHCYVSNSKGEVLGNGCLTVISATTEFDLVESEKTSPLRNISMADINKETLPEIVNSTEAVLRENTTTSAFDVILVANILENATRLRNIPIETATDILEIVEIVAGLNQTVLDQSNTVDNATNRVLQAVESLGDSVSLGDSGSARIQTNNTVLQVWNLTAVSDSHVLGLELVWDSGEVTEIREGQGRGNRSEGELQHDNTDTAIMLPGKTFRSILENYPGRDIRVSGSVFTKTSLFRSSAPTVTNADSRHRHATLNSKVIALRITVDGQPETNLSAFGDGRVTTVFTPIQSLSKEQSFQRELSSCVFWDFALQDGKGAWSEEGCYHSDTVQGKVVCECDHLTNFAVLLDMYGQESRKEKIAHIHEAALSIISEIGLGLSVAGLSFTVISFIVIKKLHSSNSQQTLFNLALALLLAWVTFLAGFSRVHGHVSCVLVAALLHYLILVSFMWMVIEGILLFLQFKARKGGISRYMLKTALPAWGLPLIPVIIILSIDVNLYSGGKQYCWMSHTPFYYAFLTPIAIMVSANIVLYVLIVVSICRRRDMSHGGTSYNVISIRASIASFVVLGLSWVFAFFAIEDARLVFQYLFTLTTACQGVLISAIFTARDAAVRQFWLDLIFRRKQVGRGSRGSLPLRQSAPDRSVTKETSFNRSK